MYSLGVSVAFFKQPAQLPNYMGWLMEFYTSLTLFYTKMSFKILKF
jgi:hypothetical protein